MYWQLCRNHELHYANSSTSFHDFIYFIELTHTAAVAEGVECGGWRRRIDGWRSRMQWPKETNAMAEGVECGGWRSRMRWPKESNAVAGGDTFWTLITRDCCITLNWVHLKKSRIIFFVIVTYWQSMARFRKNDFFKWAQKIKSVFCFIPHTHEGCDSTRISERSASCRSFNPHTHEGCDAFSLPFGQCQKVSIHTPTKGVTYCSDDNWQNDCCFNPHTHEGCDFLFVCFLLSKIVSIHTPTKGVTS